MRRQDVVFQGYNLSPEVGVGDGEQEPGGEQDVFWSIKGSVGWKAPFPLPSGNVTEGHLVLTCQRDHPGYWLSPPFSASPLSPRPCKGPGLVSVRLPSGA